MLIKSIIFCTYAISSLLAPSFYVVPTTYSTYLIILT